MRELLYLVIAAAALIARPYSGFSQSTSPEDLDYSIRFPLITARAAGRFLDQATWGPTPASIELLQQIGIDEWLNWQFSLKTSDLPDQPILGPDGRPNRDLRPVQIAFLENAVSGEDQLRQRVAFALSKIWVVSAREVPDAYAFPPYWRIFRDNAFSNYRDIIRAVTLNPAMGRYLNMANNNKANPARGTVANENYARELMQLFTIGLTQLNLDGSLVLDQDKMPVPTYDQNIVNNMARVLTGWTSPTAPGAVSRGNNPAYYIGQMFAVERNHDTSAKEIFGGYTIRAGQSAEQDLESLIDALMAQETMAPFVCKQLIQQLVTSNSSPEYIRRVAGVFLDNGSGVRGDMRAVITAILTDPEARDEPGTSLNSNFGHLREPVLFMANILRGLNATLGPLSTIYDYTRKLGQDLFSPPSVFSYFSPQYRVQRGLLGPEFQIYSTQTASDRANVINSVLYGRLDRSTAIDLAPFLQFSGNIDSLLDYISYVFLHDAMSPDLRRAAYEAASAAGRAAGARVRAALYTVLTSGEYQIIH